MEGMIKQADLRTRQAGDSPAPRATHPLFASAHASGLGRPRISSTAAKSSGSPAMSSPGALISAAWRGARRRPLRTLAQIAAAAVAAVLVVRAASAVSEKSGGAIPSGVSSNQASSSSWFAASSMLGSATSANDPELSALIQRADRGALQMCLQSSVTGVDNGTSLRTGKGAANSTSKAGAAKPSKFNPRGGRAAAGAEDDEDQTEDAADDAPLQPVNVAAAAAAARAARDAAVAAASADAAPGTGSRSRSGASPLDSADLASAARGDALADARAIADRVGGLGSDAASAAAEVAAAMGEEVVRVAKIGRRKGAGGREKVKAVGAAVGEAARNIEQEAQIELPSAAAPANLAPKPVPGAFKNGNTFFHFLGRERGNFNGITDKVSPRSAPLARKRGLLAAPVSDKSKDQFLPVMDRFLDEGMDVVLFHFDDSTWTDVPRYANVTSIRVKGQTKFWYAKRFLMPQMVENYDYIFLWDDDVGLKADWSPTEFVAIMQQFGLHAAQPALDKGARQGYPQYETVRWHQEVLENGGVGRFADFVEVMFPVYSREAWQNCIWETIPYDGRSFWGVDNAWYPHCASAGYCRFAVVDAMPVDHLDTRTLVQSAGPNLRELAYYFRNYRSVCATHPDDVPNTDTAFRIFLICMYIKRHPLGLTFRQLGEVSEARHGGPKNAATCPEPGAWPGIANKPWYGDKYAPAVPYPYSGNDVDGAINGTAAALRAGAWLEQHPEVMAQLAK